MLRAAVFVRIACPAGAVLALLASAAPAAADFRVCNSTASRIGAAIGYRAEKGWVSEGWWNVAPGGCETIVRGPLPVRFYYLYAVDYDQGGEWSGKAFLCTREKAFTIEGVQDCRARGFDRTGFFEIDTQQEQRNWTVRLSTQAVPGALPKSNAPPEPGAGAPPAAAPPPGGPSAGGGPAGAPAP